MRAFLPDFTIKVYKASKRYNRLFLRYLSKCFALYRYFKQKKNYWQPYARLNFPVPNDSRGLPHPLPHPGCPHPSPLSLYLNNLKARYECGLVYRSHFKIFSGSCMEIEISHQRRRRRAYHLLTYAAIITVVFTASIITVYFSRPCYFTI